MATASSGVRTGHLKRIQLHPQFKELLALAADLCSSARVATVRQLLSVVERDQRKK